jgi:hypothetical protein
VVHEPAADDDEPRIEREAEGGGVEAERPGLEVEDLVASGSPFCASPRIAMAFSFGERVDCASSWSGCLLSISSTRWGMPERVV